MESALATLIIMMALLFGTYTLADTYFATQDQLWQTRTLMEGLTEVQQQTALALVASTITDAGETIELTFRNVGRSKIADFDQWDLIVQYYSAADIYAVQWLPYSRDPTPGTNQWTVAGLYLSASAGTPEIYEPAILNPGEEIVIAARVVPPVGPNTTNLATIAVGNGNHQSVLFARE